ncbi:sporulation phosphorelay system protein KapB [Brevibacillus ginsengisoli]|uniref:sporulation phosphorelay system protein KapB n=1 Tax=Brevibacillus ginsengisoli TaxID=363854 RepID=UPI003CE86630
MTNQSLQVGDLVLASNKSGVYIAEIIDLLPLKATIQTLAVVKHPLQGDLHHPYEANVSVFHQRRALSYRERFMTLLSQLEPYEGEVPEYQESLRDALDREITELGQQDGKWAELSLQQYKLLKQEYVNR